MYVTCKDLLPVLFEDDLFYCYYDKDLQADLKVERAVVNNPKLGCRVVKQGIQEVKTLPNVAKNKQYECLEWATWVCLYYSMQEEFYFVQPLDIPFKFASDTYPELLS